MSFQRLKPLGLLRERVGSNPTPGTPTLQSLCDCNSLSALLGRSSLRFGGGRVRNPVSRSRRSGACELNATRGSSPKVRGARHHGAARGWVGRVSQPLLTVRRLRPMDIPGSLRVVE